MNYLTRANELKEETILNRRYIHQNAEVGLDLPKTKAYVMNKLKEYGIEPKDCGYGVTATIGNGGKTILLRADMDALPMSEESELSFACPSKSEAHACGHDMHAAMLLTAARMLKENEANLKGTVKLMFQPAEETFQGSQNMIENGILDDVDVALAYHVAGNHSPIGLFMYNSNSTMMSSVDGFKITITGKGSHGAYPNMSIDPINIGTHIYLALQALIAREANPEKANVLTIGQFQAGNAANIIPETAVLQGTIRSNDVESRKLLVRRLQEVCEGETKVFGGKVEVEWTSCVPPLICNKEVTEAMVKYMKEMDIPSAREYPGITANGSEDFAVISEKVPSCFMYLGAGFPDERGDFGAHNPKVQFNEDALPVGAACYATCATRWLEEQE